MNRQWRRGTAWAGFVLLSACATPNVPSDYEFHAERLTGIVVLALGWFEPANSLRTWHNDEVTDLTIFYVDAATAKEQRIELNTRGQTHNLQPTNAKYGRSRLVVAELPVGSYDFVGWQIGTTASEVITADRITPIHFTVEAGKPIYLGAYLLELLRDKGWLRTTKITHARLKVRDEQTRDSFYLARHYPGIAAKPLLNMVPTVRHYPSPISISYEPEEEDDYEDEED